MPLAAKFGMPGYPVVNGPKEETMPRSGLLEHRWAIPLRDAVRRGGGVALADAWIHSQDLVLYGVATNLV